MRLMRRKEEELAEEMKEYRLDILGVSETHLRSCDEKQVGEAEMVFSGVLEGGVAIIIL